MKGLLLCFAASIQSNNRDAAFHSWCSDVGISCPGAEVRTTPESVAGRGVFSKHDLSRGDEVISIPLYAALTQDNAARYFPTLEKKLKKCRTKEHFLKRLWNRIRRRPTLESSDADKYWGAELSAYAMQALVVDHPWSAWISQWQREDPMQSLVDMSTWRYDDEAIKTAASDFHEMAPDIPVYKIGAAVGIRLHELDEYSERYDNKVPTSASMYTTLISRAIGLSGGVTAVLPMHDMINHSKDANVGLVPSDDATIKIIALRDIAKGEELFSCYQDDTFDEECEWDEDKATWLLVQWGIPSSRSEYASAEEKALQMQETSVARG